MATSPRQKEINSYLWNIASVFRGYLEPAQYRDYIFAILFIKYASDVAGDGSTDEESAHSRLIVPDGYSYYSLLEKTDDLGEWLNRALYAFEDTNPIIRGVFSHIDFLDTKLGNRVQRESLLRDALVQFNSPKLTFTTDESNEDVIGDTFSFLLGRFAAAQGKKGSDFFTPSQVSTLLAKIANPQMGERIYDPTCGSGSLLIKCFKEVNNINSVSVYGQELNIQTWATCMMNMLLHNIPADIRQGDTLSDPLHVGEHGLMTHDLVISNPPFAIKNWDRGFARDDQYNRFHRGVPPKSRGDYAFLSHMITSMNSSENARTIAVVSGGVLFRSGAEKRIRQSLIEENLLDTVIALPANMYYGTGIPVFILIFKRNKTDKDILFIDASQGYETSGGLNYLSDSQIQKIVSTYQRRKSLTNYAHIAPHDEVKENDFNLNITRYIYAYDTPEDQIIYSNSDDEYDVFISYSHANTEHQERVVQQLLDNGFRVWVDAAYNLEVGEPDWQMAIENAIENSTCVVALLSPDAKSSEWVRRELMYANRHHKGIFPVLVEGDEQSSVPILLINTQHVNLQKSYDDQMHDLIDNLKQVIDMRVVHTPYIYDIHKRRSDWLPKKLGDLCEKIRSNKYRKRDDVSEYGEYPVYDHKGDTVGYTDDPEFDGTYLLLSDIWTASQEQFAKNIIKISDQKFSILSRVQLLKIKEDSDIDLNFLLYFLWTVDFKQYLEGSTHPRLITRDIKVYLPSLAIQREIAEIITNQLNLMIYRQDDIRKRLDILESRKIGHVIRTIGED